MEINGNESYGGVCVISFEHATKCVNRILQLLQQQHDRIRKIWRQKLRSNRWTLFVTRFSSSHSYFIFINRHFELNSHFGWNGIEIANVIYCSRHFCWTIAKLGIAFLPQFGLLCELECVCVCTTYDICIFLVFWIEFHGLFYLMLTFSTFYL